MLCNSIIQQIRRQDGRCQLYVNVPAELAQAMHLRAGQSIQWLIQPPAPVPQQRPQPSSHASAGKKGEPHC